MLKIKQENIVDVFDSLTGLFDDINVCFDKDGLAIQEADRAIVCFVDVKLKPSIFEEYDLDRRECFFVNLTSLVEVLKRFKKDDRIAIEIKDNRLTLTNSDKYFKLGLLEASEEEKPSVDKLKFTIELEVKKDVFVEAIKDSSLFSESVVLEFDKNLLFKSQDANGEYQKKVFVGESDLKTILNAKCTSRYSIDYLQKIFKKSFGDKVNIKFGNDFPIKITFSEDDKEVSFILAPRILDNEEESQEVAKDKPKDDKDDEGKTDREIQENSRKL